MFGKNPVLTAAKRRNHRTLAQFRSPQLPKMLTIELVDPENAHHGSPYPCAFQGHLPKVLTFRRLLAILNPLTSFPEFAHQSSRKDSLCLPRTLTISPEKAHLKPRKALPHGALSHR